MTRFTVVWHKLARDELAEIWLDATDRRAIAAAADAIDLLLATDADDKGEEVSTRLRMLSMPPLDVLLSVRELDRIAKVIAVRRV